MTDLSLSGRPRILRRRFAAVLLLAALVSAPVLLSGCAAGPSAGPAQEARPNIVVVMADDMGYSDPGSYGGEIETPNLDRLAAEGLRFTDFYNTSRCVPTRASLLTGLYSHQAGLGAMTFDWGTPGYRGHLTDNTVTVAELLRQAGYRTGMVGKWHLSETIRREPEQQLEWLAHRAHYGPFSPLEQYPTARGFDDYYGNIWGVVDYFDPFSLVDGTEAVDTVPVDYYHTDAISDTAAAYVERYSREERPFFLYVAYTAPHWPLQALPEDIARYEHTYDAGWDAVREARYGRMVEQGIVPAGALSPRIRPELDWETHEGLAWDARSLAVHAAMVDRLDQGLGRILGALEETGELDNTLILFLSDNGASPERPSEYGPGFDRAGSTRDHREVYFPVDKTQLPGPQVVHSGIGRMGANTMNTPFRYWKARVYEGGIATPLIAHWPAGLEAEAGSLTRQPGHVIDIAATALDLAGVEYPETFEGRRVTPIEGRSLVPILKGRQRAGHEALFWEHNGSSAVRRGDWKLVRLTQEDPWELYDLSVDRTELYDLSGEHPERVRELEALWEEWAERVHVFPRRR